MKKLASLLLVLALVCACAWAEVIEIVGAVSSAAVEVTATPEPETLAELAGVTPSAEETVTPEPTAVPRLHGLKIGIDPGHQGKANSDKEPVAPGSSEKKAKVASGTSSVNTGRPEYETVLEISLILRDLLQEMGAEVIMTRESHDVDISNKERAELMNSQQADLVLRVHCDGANDKSANGIACYVRKTGEKQEESEAAAECIVNAMVEATGAKNRGVHLRDTYTMNNWSTVPCILVECGFMTNPQEDANLNDPAYQLLLAQGMTEGVAAYFER